MKRLSGILLVVIVLFGTTTSADAQQNKAEKLYQQALYEMEGRGNYSKAIELFNQVVNQFPKEKSTGAKALLYTGQCYEKLGMKEAAKAYEKIVKEYADQREVLAEARKRLASLRERPNAYEGTGTVVRQVWMGEGVDVEGGISADGRYLSFTDWSTGDIAVRDLLNGKSRRLTNEGSWEGEPKFSDFSTMSPDGKFVAYAWCNGKTYELRVIGADGSGSRTLLKNLGWVRPHAVSPDAATIVVSLYRPRVSSEDIGLASVLDGSVRVIKSIGKGDLGKASFSPDGRWIVYDARPTEETPERDIFLLAADGSREVRLIDHPSDDFYPLWTPDGNGVVFVSDRGGTTGLWYVRVTNGEVQGTPQLLKSGFERNLYLLGLTESGALYYGVVPGSEDIYVADIEERTGTLVSPPRLAVERYTGFNSVPAWSPDGKHLAFISGRGNQTASGLAARRLIVKSMRTGEEHELAPQMGFGFQLKWSPDGRYLLANGWDLKGPAGLQKVDVQTGQASSIRGGVGTSNEGHGAFGWFPDGESVFFSVNDSAQSGRVYLLRRNLKSGQEQRIGQFMQAPHYMVLSPQGRQFAYWYQDKKTAEVIIELMSAGEGTTREAARLKEGLPSALAWTPDGQYLMLARKTGPLEKMELWRVPVQGGEPEKLGLLLKDTQDLVVHPGGKRIAFSVRGYRPEVWVMENFLPKEDMSSRYTAPLIWQVWEKGADITGAPTTDGKYLTCTDWETGDLALRDLATGQTRRLTNKGSWSQSSEFAQFSVPSPDGKQVAYCWLNSQKIFDLRVINIDKPEQRVLVSNEDIIFAMPFCWTPDGKRVVAMLERKGRVNQIGFVSISDKAVRILKTLDWRWPNKVSISRDGRFIVYDLPTRDDAPERDIFLLASDGSGETKLIDHPANDMNPIWTLDGTKILFVSDRTGSNALYGMSVVNGKATGRAQIMKSDVGRMFPLGLTKDGFLYYGLETGMDRLYLASVDFESCRTLTQPTELVLPYEGANRRPDWSPDGKCLSYISERGFIGARVASLVIRSVSTGKEKILTPDLVWFNRQLWHPDCRSIIVTGSSKKGLQGFFRVDIESGNTSPFVLSDPGSYVSAPSLSPDGEKVSYVLGMKNTNKIVVTNTRTGEGKELVSFADREISDPAISPDGSKLAFRLPDSLGTSVFVMPANGGSYREVVRTKNPETIKYGTLVWSREGKYLVYVKSWIDKTKKDEIWRVDAETGEQRKLELAMDGIQVMRVHPDGKQLVLSAGQYKAEVWVMENFLPK